MKERKAAIDAELEPLRVKEWRAYEQCNTEFSKQERYCKEQREVLRALEELKAQEKKMYELDHRKDQIMTSVKVALANLAMWTRDQYFPHLMRKLRGSGYCHFSSFLGPLRVISPRSRSSYIRSTTALSIVT